MVQTAAILQMNSQELEQYLQELALENPVIELEEPELLEDGRQIEFQRKLDWLEETDYQNRAYYQEERRAAGNREESWLSRSDSEISLSEYLRQQLEPDFYSGRERRILNYLLESLDDRGYFTDGTWSAAEVLHVPEKKVKAMLEILKKLEPAGVGAKDLKECLLLQLQRTDEDTELAEKIVSLYLEKLGRNHLKEIAKELHVSGEQIQEACRLIRSLDPKPGSAFFTGEPLHYIRPDIFIMPEEGMDKTFRVIIREGGMAGFRVSEYYQKLEKETNDPETRQYLKEKLTQAFSVERDMETRKITLYRVAGAIVNYQADFFASESRHRKPLKLSDLAGDLGLHESTVSRALKGKYLQCGRGVFPLRYFLTGTISAHENGDTARTPDEVKEAICRIVAAEDKMRPLNDGEIQDQLALLGIRIARRTVNKYRQELNIPDKTGRKMWR